MSFTRATKIELAFLAKHFSHYSANINRLAQPAYACRFQANSDNYGKLEGWFPLGFEPAQSVPIEGTHSLKFGADRWFMFDHRVTEKIEVRFEIRSKLPHREQSYIDQVLACNATHTILEITINQCRTWDTQGKEIPGRELVHFKMNLNTLEMESRLLSTKVDHDLIISEFKAANIRAGDFDKLFTPAHDIYEHFSHAAQLVISSFKVAVAFISPNDVHKIIDYEQPARDFVAPVAMNPQYEFF